ncbi:hypothetical protein ACSBR1_040377 [Camellia fascicularis]
MTSPSIDGSISSARWSERTDFETPMFQNLPDSILVARNRFDGKGHGDNPLDLPIETEKEGNPVSVEVAQGTEETLLQTSDFGDVGREDMASRRGGLSNFRGGRGGRGSGGGRGQGNTKSWADMAASSSRSTIPLTYVPPNRSDGYVSVSLPPRPNPLEKWDSCLVGVCVEVEATSNLPSMFSVNCEDEDAVVRVEYQGLPPKCDHCVVFGHDTTKCVKTQVAALINLQKQTEDNPNPGWETVKAKGKRKVDVPETPTVTENYATSKEDGLQEPDVGQSQQQELLQEEPEEKVYWSSLFILPKKVIREIDSLLRAFLWSGKSFWKVKVPNDPSWVWRKLLSLRDWVSPLIKHKIGCGDATFLWYDNWHPLGSLWNKFGDRIIYDSTLNSETKVSQIIDGSSWKWPIPNSWEIQELISSTPVGCKPNPSSSDTALWKLTTDGQFSIQSAWNHWRKKFDKVVWHKLVWGPHRIPKASFIVWVALHNRLYTGDRLCMFVLAISSQCPFCLIPEESHLPLFFKCIFSSRVWCAIEAVCNIKWPVLGWPNIVTYATKETKGNSLRVNIISNAFLCSVYFIWIERNNRIFNKEFKPEEVVIKSVIQMVRNRMLSIKNIPRSTGDSWFLAQWNLPETILKPHNIRYGRAAE